MGPNPKFDIFVHPGEIDALPAHMRDFLRRYSYPHLEAPGIRIVDCDDGKFMDHADRPNTDFNIFDKGYALTDIPVGTEITCSYYEFDPEFRVLAPLKAWRWRWPLCKLQRPAGRRVAC